MKKFKKENKIFWKFSKIKKIWKNQKITKKKLKKFWKISNEKTKNFLKIQIKKSRKMTFLEKTIVNKIIDNSKNENEHILIKLKKYKNGKTINWKRKNWKYPKNG